MGPRDHFATRLGFVLAAAGSAVGLGNIWKFPFMAGQNGGGAFLILYVAFVLTIGLSVMLSEYAIGRAGQRNPVGAFRVLKGGAWPAVGALGVIAGFVILSFYSVVGGWTLAYAIKSVSGALASNDPKVLGAAFGAFIAEPRGVIAFHTAFMAMTLFIVAGGVQGGIERASRVLMPALAILVVVLAVRSVTLEGASKGIAFFLTPDFSRVTWGTVNAALGQAFFSLSLGMGTMMTYASYLDKQVNLPKTAAQVTLLDTGFAVVAGFMILPAVFAFGFDPQAGPGLTFITLPAVFAQMPAGPLFAFLFFALLAIAALTSAVSIIEPVVSYLIDERGVSRRAATWGAGAVTWALGVPSALSLGPWKDVTLGGKGILDAVDYLASNIMLPVGGILITLFIGWSIADRAKEEAQSDGVHPFALANVWIFICRFVAPAAVAWVLIGGL
ncbi:MAG: sodium-dependent transporter [Rhodospirillales bacterium CG15_BIG_FIL_POST_REV_8_21_14_020_66_15]|nr:MAG: sodium-dependent transporter [Rhodospirillales bacterium CG15_BIG_FIL_POST_REV_8_21_14_020_66_15]